MTGRREMDENDGKSTKFNISILIRISSKEIKYLNVVYASRSNDGT